MSFQDKTTSGQDILPDTGSHGDLDENVVKALPLHSKVISFSTYGTTAWTRAVRVDVELSNGSEKSYFLKCATGDQARLMMPGEFVGISEIAKFVPELTPTPYAHGKFKNSSMDTYFFLMEFLDIDTGAPEPAAIGQQLATLHARSRSPTGQFGFPITTCHGPHPQNNEWEASWSVFFARLTRQFFDRELATNGPSADGKYEKAIERLISTTIPKILDPLQSDGRYLKPSLVHGNLWQENCGTDLETGQPKIFDASCFYGHNEYDLGMWRRDVIQFGKAHMRQYLSHMAPSEPREQWDDRNRLYCIKFEVAHSIGWPASCESQREAIMRDMAYLSERYSPISGGQSVVADNVQA